MRIRNLASELERQEYSKIYDIAIRTNYSGLLFPDEFYPKENIFGCFQDDKLAAALFIIDYDAIRIRNKRFEMGGVEGVVTAPGYRGNGVAKRLFRHVFEELNKRSQFLSVLFPISHWFYEKLGYGIADEHIFYQFALDNIKRKKHPNRSFVMVDDITDDIKFVYANASAQYNYIADRFDAEWNLKKDQADFIYVCYDEEEKPTGYCLLKFLKDHYLFQEPSQTVHVPEAFWLDNATKHAIFQDFLSSFAAQRKYGSVVLPMNENLIELLHDPIIQVRTIKPSSRIRIINAEEVLSNLEYNVKDFALAIRIHDDLCDWNNKTLLLQSKDGKVTTIEDDTSQEVDLETDITSLAQLIVGSRSIHDLIEFQKIEVKHEKHRLIHELFPKQINFFRDFF